MVLVRTTGLWQSIRLLYVVDGRKWLLLSIMQRSAPPLSFPSGTKSEPVSCVALSTCKAESASLPLLLHCCAKQPTKSCAAQPTKSCAQPTTVVKHNQPRVVLNNQLVCCTSNQELCSINHCCEEQPTKTCAPQSITVVLHN